MCVFGPFVDEGDLRVIRKGGWTIFALQFGWRRGDVRVGNLEGKGNESEELGSEKGRER